MSFVGRGQRVIGEEEADRLILIIRSMSSPNTILVNGAGLFGLIGLDSTRTWFGLSWTSSRQVRFDGKDERGLVG